ncbi:MAG: hypothetical protein ACLSWV_02700 [Pygmaiobacter massiliensis]
MTHNYLDYLGNLVESILRSSDEAIDYAQDCITTEKSYLESLTEKCYNKENISRGG